MDIDTENRPFCKCHKTPMTKNGIQNGVQEFVCTIKKSKRCKKYLQTPAGIASNRRGNTKFNNSVSGYIYSRKYRLNKMREENLLRLKSLQEENPWLTN